MNGESAVQEDGTSRLRFEKDKNERLGSTNPQLSVKRRRPGKSEVGLYDDRAQNGQSDVQREHIQTEKDVAKGREKIPNGNIAPTPKGIHRLFHRRERSIGGSPLATEVINSHPVEADDGRQLRTSGSMRSTGSTRAPDSVPWTGSEGGTGRTNNALGFDTDPAQIVNLALSLSESRRRNFSSGGFRFGREPSSNRRVTSFGSQVSNPPYGQSGGSLRQHLQQQRQGNASPRSYNSAGRRRVISAASQQSDRPNRPVSYLHEGFSETSNAALNASDATVARVEKAREAFELMYEYRRLLQFLPETTVGYPAQPQARRGSKKTSVASNIVFGREYNPLQYVRNRKVRLRERRPINAEAEGWKDIEQVRSWVDRVRQEREDDISPVDERHLLPPFDANQIEATMTDDFPAPNAVHSKSNQNHKVGRPHNDWTITSWELLADIHWRYQDDNMKSMEDASGHRLFIDRVLHTDSPRMSKESARPLGTSRNLHKAAISPERIRIQAADDGRKPRDVNDGKPLEQSSDTGERGRRGRWTKSFIRSREPSLSDDSDWEQQNRSRPKNRTEREHLDNIALEKQMMEMLESEKDENTQTPQYPNKLQVKLEKPQLPSLETSPQSDTAQKSSPPRPRPHRLKTDMPISHKQFSPPRTSLDDQVLRHRRLSSDDFDITNPNSPTSTSFIPSIAINFSPPTSPSVTATSPKNPSPSKPESSRRVRSPELSTQAVGDHDFADEPTASKQPSHNNQVAKVKHTSENSGSSLENVNGHLSPNKSTIHKRRSDLHDSPSTKGFKEPNEPESRFRGLLKAGRVVDIVGNQVSRAGDMLWRKDRSKHAASFASPASSYPSDSSENGDADVSAFDSSPQDLSRATTNNDSVGQMSRVPTQAERPKYFMDNLPSFKSPAEKRDPSPKSPKATPERDPIVSQQQALKERGRPSRFDQLPPPKIDMRGVSPSPSPPATRSQSRGFNENESQDSSGSRSRSRMTSHTRLNNMLGIPGQVGTVSNRPTPTGLSSLEAQRQPLKARPNLQAKRQWSISDRGMTMTFETITARDIARVRALLLTSGVKANEIARRADEVPSQPSKFLQRINTVLESPLPCASQAQEHVIAARALLTSIDTSNHALQDAETRFSSITVKEIENQLTGIDRRVNASLTPLVREFADDADAFSAELTSSHTLTVKQLNDQVDLILRRRRRRSRWMRRGGWTLLEWVVLGTMWAVWFIVVIVRLARGTVGLVPRLIRWLFWL